MRDFNSLSQFDSLCGCSMVSGVLVFWDASGICSRVHASYSSLPSLLRDISEWSCARLDVVSVSFWVGDVLLARCYSSLAVSLGVCSDASAMVPFSCVS